MRIVRKVEEYVKAKGLKPDDLLFEFRQAPGAKSRLCSVPNPGELGYTDPNDAGRTYRHGTLSAYSAGKCRCEHCRAAYAVYRAERRNAGKDAPRRPRLIESDGHIPRDWFRTNVWKPALSAAAVQGSVQAKHLRHAHAGIEHETSSEVPPFVSSG